MSRVVRALVIVAAISSIPVAIGMVAIGYGDVLIVALIVVLLIVKRKIDKERTRRPPQQGSERRGEPNASRPEKRTAAKRVASQTIQLSEEEVGVLIEQMQGIGERLPQKQVGKVIPLLAHLTAGAMTRRAKRIQVDPGQAEIILRAIEDNDGLRDVSRREEARAELRKTPLKQLRESPALSLMKKLAHVVPS